MRFPPGNVVSAKTPDLNLLPIAVALYDELSVSRVARQLGMSQPAVSKALRRLRETFDDALFVRGPSGIMPTPRAHAIVRAARPHLEHLREDLLKGEQFDPATSTRPIVLGLSDIAEMAFLAEVIAGLVQGKPPEGYRGPLRELCAAFPLP